MNLYMVELTVIDWPAAVAWYRDMLGLKVLLQVEADGFALFQAGEGRLALKRATAGNKAPKLDQVMLVFEVADLPAEITRLAAQGVLPELPPRSSPEGYRRAIFRDPEGYRVCLFDWKAKKD